MTRRETRMYHKRFAFNYLLIWSLIIPILLIVIYLVWSITSYAIYIGSSDHPLPNNLWAQVIGADIFFILAGIAICLGPIWGLLTEITAQNIRKPSIRGYITIKWSDVTSVYILGSKLTIKTKDTRMHLNLMLYRDPDDVIQFIQNCLPPHLKQSFESITKIV